MRVGLIGLGAIGGEIVRLAESGSLGEGLELVAVLVRRERSPLAGTLVTTDLGAFLATGPEVVLEVAGHSALRDHGEACLAAGADLVITSAGALTDDGLLKRLLAAARARRTRLAIASAGIGALDILAGAAVGGLDRVRVKVAKDPSAWYGTAAERLVDLANLTEPTVIFQGTVREGAALYPQNVNISAAAAFAGLGLDRTELVILADPTITKHVVEIDAEGTFGKFHFREDVEPTKENPKTGEIVAMAVVKTLRQLSSPFVVGV